MYNVCNISVDPTLFMINCCFKMKVKNMSLHTWCNDLKCLYQCRRFYLLWPIYNLYDCNRVKMTVYYVILLLCCFHKSHFLKYFFFTRNLLIFSQEDPFESSGNVTMLSRGKLYVSLNIGSYSAISWLKYFCVTKQPKIFKS